MMLSKIRGFRSSIINAIIDVLSSIQLQLEALKRNDWIIFENRGFRVDRVSNTSVKVHAGYWKRMYGTTSDKVDLTVDDSNTSDDYSLFKTINGINSDGYVYIKLDSAQTPTAVDASFTSGALQTQKTPYRVVAKITTDSGNITPNGIEQLHLGSIDEEVLKHRWKVTRTTNTSVTVGDGDILTPSARVSWSSGDVTGLSAATEYIFARLDAAQTAITVEHSSTWPPSSWPGSRPEVAHLLAIVTLTAGAISNILPVQFSDIEEQLPDGSAFASNLKSLEISVVNGRWQLFGFNGASVNTIPYVFDSGGGVMTIAYRADSGTGGTLTSSTTNAAGTAGGAVCVDGHTHEVTSSQYATEAGTLTRVDGHVDVAHTELSDMPDSGGTNADHDARYFRHVGQAGEAKDFKTTGYLDANAVKIDSSDTNKWSAASLDITVSGNATITSSITAKMHGDDINLTSLSSLALTVPGDITLNGIAGRTVTVMGTDNATGEPVELIFRKGWLMES